MTMATTRIETPSADLVRVAEVPGAVAINVASDDDHAPVVVWTTSADVQMARFDSDAGTLGPARVVSGDVEPFAHPIERPATAIMPDGSIVTAFTALAGDSGSVFYTRFADDSEPDPAPISGDPQPETNLVHAAVDEEGQTALAWLEDSTLSVATAEPGGAPIELELIDDSTCDCCNPAPAFVGDALVVPYRDYDLSDGEVVRNVAAVRSLDGGKTFEDTVPIADDPWYIDACPFSGPSAVQVGGTLVVAFMDARQSVHPDQSSSSIWVDISQDGGATFGSDLEVSAGGINRWPVIAVDETDAIHLIWETPGSDGGLSYATSHDRGATFTEPVVLVTSADSAGSPKSPSVAHHRGRLLVTWTDADGGHLGVHDLG